jgi:hypothetical protein
MTNIRALRYWFDVTVRVDSFTVDGAVDIEFECLQSTNVIRLLVERQSMRITQPPVLT